MKLWDLGQRRCIATYAMHDDSIWAVRPNADFSRIYTGGRDNNVFVTDISNPADASVLLVSAPAPVLKLELSGDEQTLWVATTSSSVTSWSTKRAEVDDEFDKLRDGVRRVLVLGWCACQHFDWFVFWR
jgi:WD repeat-containing protein 48